MNTGRGSISAVHIVADTMAQRGQRNLAPDGDQPAALVYALLAIRNELRALTMVIARLEK